MFAIIFLCCALHYFFTEKEESQIQAIKEVLRIQPSLCLGHLKRAIPRNIVDASRKVQSKIYDNEESLLMSGIEKHYF